jgi:hypothetical protein
MAMNDQTGKPPTTMDALVSEVDRLLASDADGNDEAALLEQAHRMINNALEGR